MSSLSENSSKKMITLKSLEGETFEVEEAVILESQTIKHMVEDDCAEGVIPLPNVRGAILSMVIDYLKKHTEGKATEDDLRDWDADFAMVGQETLYDLLMAANYLDIKSLLDLLCQTVADMIRGKSPEEIRQTFHIQNDFTPAEEEEIRREAHWAF